MKKRTVKDFIALYAPEDEEKLVLIQDGVSADKTFLDTYWAAHTHAVKRFESRYAPIPAEYRWLLLNFGGCYLAEPWIFTLKELEEAYPTFQDAFVDYMSECEHGPVFPIGGLGDGSIVFLDLESGRVQGYNCDYSNLEEIANSFSSLLLSLVEQALEIGKLCGES